jgi:hypothetical protein
LTIFSRSELLESDSAAGIWAGVSALSRDCGVDWQEIRRNEMVKRIKIGLVRIFWSFDIFRTPGKELTLG